MSIAVITGASSGIGKEFAVSLDSYGLSELWLIARSEDKLDELREHLKTPCRVLPIDLTKEKEIEKYTTLLQEEAPNIMYLINDSGFGKFGRFDGVSDRDIVDMIDLNAKGLVLLTMHSIPYMPEGAAIINMSSSAAFNPLPNFNVYAATKAFVYHYSRALREELRDREIAVTTVCPGWVDTNFLDVADSDYTTFRPKKFRPLYSAADIVQNALKDSDHDKALSVYGFHTKLHRLASKLIPDCLLIAKWLKMQIRK